MKEKQKKISIKLLILIIISAALLITGSILGYKYFSAYHVSALTTDDLSDIDFEKADKLMIVAHPDDETIWGGGHLMDGDYLVVCITNGKNKVRCKEFSEVIEASGNQGIILNYPDKVLGKRDDWSKVKDKISSDLGLIIKHKDWGEIVTHNSRGEYGHQHHIMTHDLTTEAYLSAKSSAELLYFGKYYKKVDLPEHEKELERLSDEQVAFKRELYELYDSQKGTLDSLWHMAPYENFTRYSDEKSGN